MRANLWKSEHHQDPPIGRAFRATRPSIRTAEVASADGDVGAAVLLPGNGLAAHSRSHSETPQAFAKLINRLLDSPRYGEHWGRHWLGVARYADPHLYADLPSER